MRQGEARQGDVYLVNSVRFAVLSGDLHNEGADAMPLCAPIVRRHREHELNPFAVTLHDTDNVTGTILTAELAPILPPAAEPETRLGGITMQAAKDSLRALFDM